MADLELAATFSNVVEAQLARSYLESHGIASLVPDAHTAANLSYMTPAFGGVRLLVDTSRLTEAQAVLRQANFALVDADAGESDLATPAPKAGAALKRTAEADVLERPAEADVLERPAEADPLERPAEADLRRAVRCAVFGLLFGVPALFSFFYLGRYLRRDSRWAANFHVWAAVALNLATLAFYSYFIHLMRSYGAR